MKYINSISEKKIVKLGDKNKKEIKEIITDRKNEFIKTLGDSTYIFDKDISNYLKGIVKEISVANPNIDFKNFYFLVNKSPIPNAACYGNGMFTINLGLFNLVENDDELAFILSHEVAHYVLEHNDKSLLSYIQTLNSKDTKSKLNKVKNQEYGRRKAYSTLVKELSYNFLKRSRKAETQADSLGLAIFSKTKFNKQSSVTALKKLDFVDDMVFNEETKLKEHFNFDSYPFKEAWLTKDETLFDLKEKSDDYALSKDSLKTHPDIPVRVEALQKLLKTQGGTPKPASELERIKKIASENSISIFLDDLSLDLALYQTLVLRNKNQIDEKSYCKIMALLLKKTYQLKNGHTFGKFVSPVSTFSDEKQLNEVRTFLHNLEVKTTRKIGHSFCTKHESLMLGDEEFKSIADFFKTLNTK
ncbi:M48 family metalloprotease [Flavobacterium pedocola]